MARHADTPSRAIHGFVALKALWSWARWIDTNSSQKMMATCPGCNWKTVPRDPSAGKAAEGCGNYSLFGDDGLDDSEDVEPAAST